MVKLKSQKPATQKEVDQAQNSLLSLIRDYESGLIPTLEFIHKIHTRTEFNSVCLMAEKDVIDKQTGLRY